MLKVNRTDWDLSSLFKGDNDPAMEISRKNAEEAAYNFINKWKERTDYLQNPETLKEALDEYEFWARNFGTAGDEGFYFYLRNFQDQLNPTVKAKVEKIEEFSNKIENDIQFFEHRISKIPENQQKKFLDSPHLQKYRHFLEMSFASAKYKLSENEEKVMNLVTSSSYDKWVKMVSSSISKEEKLIKLEEGRDTVKTFEELLGLTENNNKKIRDKAAELCSEILLKHSNMAESEINAIMSFKKVNDDLRKMHRPDLERHVDDDIDSEIVDILIECITRNYYISHKYYELKAKLFRQEKLSYFERNLPFGRLDKNYSIDEAANLVHKALKNLDLEFSSIFENLMEKGAFDFLPKKGKSGGAFCFHDLIKQNTYILLNFDGQFDDVRTLAHEVGHALNNELMKKIQNSLNFETPKSTAEVASTFIEDFILQEIEKEADDELKLSIIMSRLNQNFSTIFRQTAFYKFEEELHKSYRESGFLPKEEIGKIFLKNLKNYMGPAIDFPNEVVYWWVYIPHFRDFFYVYSYASGLLISKALQNKVKKDPLFIEKVKDFLSSGTSDSPKNHFLKLGIDISKKEFWESGIRELEELLAQAEGLAIKLGKI